MNKKILSSLITTLLIISILAFPAPYVSADENDDLIFKLSLDEGPIGVTVTVSGNTTQEINSTYPVYIYWCTDANYPGAPGMEGYGVEPEGKLLETVEEPIEGTTKEYEVDITVPHVSSSGTYYIVAWHDLDGDGFVQDSEWDNETFTVVAGIYPDEGNVGDEVVVGGWTNTTGGLVEVYWENQSPENKLGEAYAKADKSFTVTVTVPETVNGTYSIIVIDERSGDLVFVEEFDLMPEITLSPETALQKDTITVEGTGFAGEQEITLSMYNTTAAGTIDWEVTLTTDPETVETDANGSFTCTFKVPAKDDDKDVIEGDYTIEAVDEDGNSATASLTIGAAITLSPEEGPAGTVVTITGRGWKQMAGKEITVLAQNATGLNTTCPLVDTIKIKTDGTFKGKFIVPSLPVDVYTINATAEGVSGTADFNVTGTTGITLTPDNGAPGSTVTIEGANFTALADIEITIDFGPKEEYATTTTNSTGGFLTAVTVPTLPVGRDYNITAVDENGLNASATFRCVMTTLLVSPSSGPTGTKVLLVGGDLTPAENGDKKEFNATINGELLIRADGEDWPAELTDDGDIPDDFYVYVPTIPAGTYTITVMDEEGVTATTTFEVTETTEIVLTPWSAPQGYNVTIELNYFTAPETENVTIDLRIYNVTEEGDVYWDTDLVTFMDQFTSYPDFEPVPTGITEVESNETGSYKAWFIIPDDLALGDYYVNATDEFGLTAEVSFSVVPPEVIVYTGANTYMPGDTVAFFAKCSLKYTGPDAPTLSIYTPSNFKYSKSIDIGTKIGEYYTGSTTLTIPTDAELGTWFWNITVADTTVNGTFTVIEKPTMETLSIEVSKLKSDVASLADTVEDLSDIVGDQASDIAALSEAVSDLKSAVSDLSDALSTLKGDVSNVASAASSAQSAAEEASKAAAGAQSAASGIQTAVYGAVILSLIAAVAAIMSIIIMQRKIAG